MVPVALARIFEALGHKKKDLAKELCLAALEDKLDSNSNAERTQAMYSLAMLFQADAEVRRGAAKRSRARVPPVPWRSRGPKVASAVFKKEGLLDDWVDGSDLDTEEVACRAAPRAGDADGGRRR